MMMMMIEIQDAHSTTLQSPTTIKNY